MENRLKFNNKYADDLGLFITNDNYPAIPMLKEIVKTYPVPNRNGNAIIKTGKYEDRVIPIIFTVQDSNTFWSNLDSIYKWLYDITDTSLYIGSMDKYFIVKNVEYEDIQRQYKKFNTIKLTFTVDPFKYKEGTISKSVSSPATNSTITISNAGDFELYPNIILSGTGDLQIVVNNETINIKSVINKVSILGDIKDCLNQNNKSILNSLNKLPKFNKGTNTIKIPNNLLSKIEINFKEKYRW